MILDILDFIDFGQGKIDGYKLENMLGRVMQKTKHDF